MNPDKCLIVLILLQIFQIKKSQVFACMFVNGNIILHSLNIENIIKMNFSILTPAFGKEISSMLIHLTEVEVR
jgi:hypothetical protein